MINEKRVLELCARIRGALGSMPYSGSTYLRRYTPKPGEQPDAILALEAILENINQLCEVVRAGSDAAQAECREFHALRNDVAAFRRLLGVDAHIAKATEISKTELTIKRMPEMPTLENLPNSMLERVLFLVRGSHNKIEAIKFLRAATGCGLKEAKEYVDNL